MATKIRTCAKCEKPIDPQDFDAGMAGEVDTIGEGITFVHFYDCVAESPPDDDQSLEERQ